MEEDKKIANETVDGDENEDNYTVRDAKDDRLIWTGILDGYLDWNFISLPSSNNSNVYKIQKGSEAYILKTICSTLENTEEIKQIKYGYNISCLAYEFAGNGVAKPINYKEHRSKKSKKVYSEMLYEYCGDDLEKALLGKPSRMIFDIMKKTLDTFAILETHNIFHSDIKPQNIAICNGIVKVIDFAYSKIFKTRSKLYSSKTSFGRTDIYVPTDINEPKYKGKPAMIDVYCWGMTLYHLIAHKSNDELAEEYISKRKDYKGFFKKLEEISIEGI